MQYFLIVIAISEIGIIIIAIFEVIKLRSGEVNNVLKFCS